MNPVSIKSLQGWKGVFDTYVCVSTRVGVWAYVHDGKRANVCVETDKLTLKFTQTFEKTEYISVLT